MGPAGDAETMQDRLAAIEQRHDELTEQMARPEVAADFSKLQELARERASMEGIVGLAVAYRAARRAAQEARAILAEESDPDLLELAREDLESQEADAQRLEREAQVALMPRDPDDERNVIIEVRAGAGGDEAGLFAAEMVRLYTATRNAAGGRPKS